MADHYTIDRLSRSLAGTTSRRQALKLMGGGLAGSFVATTGLHIATAKPAGRADLLTNIPVEGSVTDSFGNVGTFAGTATITQFSLNEAGNLLATGTLSGTLDGVLDTAGNAITSLAGQSFSALVDLEQGSQQQQQQQQQQSCEILVLDIRPLYLDLLGLVIDTSAVHLEIRAERGPGNLLGNLLCALVGLLDDFNLGGAQGLLNRINQLL